MCRLFSYSRNRRIKISKPYIHAKSSARRFGGVPEDYLPIHEFFDSSKAALADVRHRAVLHSAFGIFIVEKVFGSTRVNSDGKTYSVRDIGEQHVMEDLGTIPSLERWMEKTPIEPWMMGKKEVKETKVIPFDVPLTQKSPGVSVTEIDDGTLRFPSPLDDIFIDGNKNPFPELSPTPPQPTTLPQFPPTDWPGIIVKD